MVMDMGQMWFADLNERIDAFYNACRKMGIDTLNDERVPKLLNDYDLDFDDVSEEDL